MGQANILWICTDQQRYDTLGCYGNSFVQTPNLDALAENGTVCEQAFCQHPMCTPSRSSFLSGRYPRTTRVRSNGQSIHEEEILITKRLADNGYVCGLAGKLHLRPCLSTDDYKRDVEERIDDGYAFFDWSHHPTEYIEGDATGNQYEQWLQEQNFSVKKRKHPEAPFAVFGVPDEYHQTTWCTNRIISQMKRAQFFDRPWCLSLNCFDPHHPFDPPPEYFERYLPFIDDIPLPIDRDAERINPWQAQDQKGAYGGTGIRGQHDDKAHRLMRAAYWAMCDHIDTNVGRLIYYLKQSGQFENTIIIFHSDHGELLGDHGMYLKGAHLYDCSIRIPLIIHGPGIPQMRIQEVVELCDLAPSICDWVGMEKHAGMQGRSLAPRMNGETDCHREDAYCESLASDISDPNAAKVTMLRDSDFKIARYHGSDYGQLFDLRNDPDEAHNLWGDPAYTEIKHRYVLRLCDRIALTADPLPEQQAAW